MPHGTSTARETLARALATTTIRRRMLMPPDLADHLLAPDDEVLLAMPGIPGDTVQILVVTSRRTTLGQWDASGFEPKDIRRLREVPAQDVRGVSYIPGLYRKVEVDVRSALDLSVEPCTVEDGVRFAHALHTLATTGQLPPPMPPEQVLAVRHARGTYSPDSVENRMRAAWDRALLATTGLWTCEEVHSGPALGWLQPGEHTLLLLIGQKGVSTEYLAVTDRRVFRGSAPGRRTKDRAPADVRAATFEEGFFNSTAKVEMHDGSTLTLGGADPLEGREFVDALNTLITTGSLPEELLPFR